MNKYKTVKKNYYFKRILKKGRNTNTAMFKVSYFKNKLGSNRIGIAINKEVRSSVKRNYLKRRIREAFRILNKNNKQGYDIVILLRNINVEFNDILKGLEECLDRLGIYERPRN